MKTSATSPGSLTARRGHGQKRIRVVESDIARRPRIALIGSSKYWVVCYPGAPTHAQRTHVTSPVEACVWSCRVGLGISTEDSEAARGWKRKDIILVLQQSDGILGDLSRDLVVISLDVHEPIEAWPRGERTEPETQRAVSILSIG